ncbi:MAG: dTDP-glucose 4,6-dehydratase [Spirochaetales bacterium]|nr:dTDP-glucose 4,6-dehydratase [Spirochaetales bacterium]
MERNLHNLLITGGAGFIGSNLIRHILRATDFTGRIVNVDKLTYAGNLENLAEIRNEFGAGRYRFERADICDQEAMNNLMRKYEIDAVIHLAAESHVDRSIVGPADFITTNIYGTFSLLEAARALWGDRHDVVFHHVSTDEVFGSLGANGYFHESTPYAPRSPYSSSKASSDHLVRAYFHTYRLPVTLSNCSNNYGPYQFPEKLIPLTVLNLLSGKEVPVYGDGKHVRDWLYVADHAAALWTIVRRGTAGESYNVGGENEMENIAVVRLLCDIIAAAKDRPSEPYKKLIAFVKDRPGHDRRYAVNCDKIKRELGWKQSVRFEEGLRSTVQWYLDNSGWVERVKTGEYKKWMEENYTHR